MALRGMIELRRPTWTAWLTPESVLAATLALVLGYASLGSDKFLSPLNLQAIASQTAVLLILAVGQTPLVVARNFDLSVGSMIAFTSVIGSMVAVAAGPLAGLLAFLVVGALAGAINGVLIAGLGLSSVVVTLGGLTFYAGLAVAIGGGASIADLPTTFEDLGNGSVGPLPIVTAIALIVLAVGLLFLHGTRFGVYVYAIGANPRAATLSGIRARSLVALLFVVSGLLAGLAGLVQTAIANVGSAFFGVAAELQVLAAVFIGGVSFYGGRGSLFGVALGVALLVVIENALNLLGFSGFVQGAVSGLVLLAAILMQRALQGGEQQ
jgi:putative xylitol transport system permease protein